MYSYSQFVEESARTEATVLHAESEEIIRTLHAAIGIVTEVEELRRALVAPQIDKVNVIEECADALWYWAIAARVYKIELFGLPEPLLPGTTVEALLEGLQEVSVSLLDYVGKKVLFYGKTLEPEVVAPRFERARSLLHNLILQMGEKPENAMERVINKLKVRYPDKFSLANAEERNLEAERKVLESQEG